MTRRVGLLSLEAWGASAWETKRRRWLYVAEVIVGLSLTIALRRSAWLPAIVAAVLLLDYLASNWATGRLKRSRSERIDG